MSRKPLVAGNWKMYKTIEEALAFTKVFLPMLEDTKDCDVCLAIPYTAIAPVAELCKGSLLQIGAQNMNDASEGAYTGEIAASMLKSAQAKFVILGHSERRHYFRESLDFIHKKVKKGLEEGLSVILCIGETLEQRESSQTNEILKEQLTTALKDIPSKSLKPLILAYEPVWAIGTGKSATPDQAEQVHQYLRELLEQEYGKRVAKATRILYGGSVNGDNAKELLEKENIDGALVGGASLKPEAFIKIVHAISKQEVL